MTRIVSPVVPIAGPAVGAAPDPRGVRVSLGPGSASAGLEPIEVAPAGEPRGVDGLRALIDGRPADATLLRLDAERAVLVRRGTEAGRERLLLLPPSAPIGAGRAPSVREVVVGGWRVEVRVELASHAALRDRARRDRSAMGHSGPTEVRAIIPGVVVSVSVAPGDAVTAGQHLLVVEAMKMQNELKAPRDGTIERVAVTSGKTIEVGDLLLVIT